jgi:hypothetical protein
MGSPLGPRIDDAGELFAIFSFVVPETGNPDLFDL